MKGFVFYWTPDDDTSKGVKCSATTETERDNILQHYFEASLGPIEDIKYPRKAIPFPGVILHGAAMLF